MTISFYLTRVAGSIAVNATRPASAGHATEVVRRVPSASNGTAGSSLAMPAFISAEEAYFWSFPWQVGIRESLAARAAGESRVFDSDDPSDVVRWLLADDDDDS
jgi:hypothetical protein